MRCTSVSIVHDAVQISPACDWFSETEWKRTAFIVKFRRMTVVT